MQYVYISVFCTLVALIVLLLALVKETQLRWHAITKVGCTSYHC